MKKPTHPALLILPLFIATLFAITQPVAAETIDSAPLHSADVPVPEATGPGIQSLAWLSGCWQGEQGEECWLPPLAGSMLGLNRSPDGGHFETLRIQAESGKVVYLASPMGRCPATPFQLTEASERRAVFSNPEHDFPQEIVYWIETAEEGGGDTLHARVSAINEGKTSGFEMTWTRGSWSPKIP